MRSVSIGDPLAVTMAGFFKRVGRTGERWVMVRDSRRRGEPKDGLEGERKVCGGEVYDRKFGENWGDGVRRRRRRWSGHRDTVIGEGIWGRGIELVLAGLTAEGESGGGGQRTQLDAYWR